MKLLRNDKTFNYDLLLDVTAIDRLPNEPRFELVYVLFSLEHNRRLIVKLKVGYQRHRTLYDRYLEICRLA